MGATMLRPPWNGWRRRNVSTLDWRASTTKQRPEPWCFTGPHLHADELRRQVEQLRKRSRTPQRTPGSRRALLPEQPSDLACRLHPGRADTGRGLLPERGHAAEPAVLILDGLRKHLRPELRQRAL